MASEIRVNKLNSQTGVGTITLSPTGVDISGITTAATLKVGTGATVSSDGDAFFTGVCTATSFVGSGANLTGISGVSVANQADNRVITNTGTTDALNAEANLTFSGSELVADSSMITAQNTGAGSGASKIQLQPYGTDGYINCTASGNLYTRMGSSFTTRTQIDSSGNFTVSSGNLVIGTSGKGIDFSADGNASGSSSEVLDDYEEGTFTPTMANSVTLHSSNDLLSYVKVGHLVHVTGVVRINSGNSSSDIAITNMPFATVNASDQAGNAIGSVSIYDNNMNSGYSQVICVMNPNSTQLNVVLQTQSGSQQLGMDAADNGYIGVSICYRSA